MDKISDSFLQFVKTIKALRTPETGCPWDLEQDHRSLRPYVVEEAYEVVQAIEGGDDHELCDELGDVLLQVVLHSQVAEDRGAFNIVDVIENVKQKMIRRHPHVFGEVKVAGADDVVRNWEKIKGQEKNNGSQDSESKHPVADRLSAIPQSLPSLLRSQRLGEKAARVHFDWDSINSVLGKVHEEFGELQAEISDELLHAKGQPNEVSKQISKENQLRLEHELGDLLFSLCQLARWLGVSAEDSLRNCDNRFLQRFRKMESAAAGKLNELHEDALEDLWQAAKKTN